MLKYKISWKLNSLLVGIWMRRNNVWRAWLILSRRGLPRETHQHSPESLMQSASSALPFSLLLEVGWTQKAKCLLFFPLTAVRNSPLEGSQHYLATVDWVFLAGVPRVLWCSRSCFAGRCWCQVCFLPKNVPGGWILMWEVSLNVPFSSENGKGSEEKRCHTVSKREEKWLLYLLGLCVWYYSPRSFITISSFPKKWSTTAVIYFWIKNHLKKIKEGIQQGCSE